MLSHKSETTAERAACGCEAMNTRQNRSGQNDGTLLPIVDAGIWTVKKSLQFADSIRKPAPTVGAAL
ncbi:MAG: hypothetical protein Fues2KO_02860 [Fuerstiella sp.]